MYLKKVRQGQEMEGKKSEGSMIHRGEQETDDEAMVGQSEAIRESPSKVTNSAGLEARLIVSPTKSELVKSPTKSELVKSPCKSSATPTRVPESDKNAEILKPLGLEISQ